METLKTELKGWRSVRQSVKKLISRVNGLSNIRIIRSGTADTVTTTENGIVINVRNFPNTKGGVGGGGGSSSHPFKMTFSLNDLDDPIVTFDAEGTEVYIRGTNDYYAPTAGTSGKPSNITSEIALASNDTNYIYLESRYDDSTSTEPDDFEIVVYDSTDTPAGEQKLTVVDTDTTPDPDVEYQSKSRVLIGTIELNSDDELTGDGLTQIVTTRLSAELFVISSAVVYLMTP